MERKVLFTVFLIGVILVFALGPDVESSDVEMKLLGRVGKKFFYRSVNRKLPWLSSLQLCRSYGLEMGSIESEAEQLGLRIPLEDEADWYEDRLWTGGFRKKNAFVWLSSGAEFKYTNWDGREPNNLEHVNCVEIHYQRYGNLGWQWMDERCDVPLDTLCESYTANPTTGLTGEQS